MVMNVSWLWETKRRVDMGAKFEKMLPSRVLNNLACCYVGLKLLETLCMRYGYTWDKVDRSAAYMARKIARDIVLAGYADKCEVQLSYAIGLAEPVGVAIECFGTEIQPIDFIQAYVRDSYDLTPRGIIKNLHLLDVDYNTISAYGHFTNPNMQWEQ